MHTTNVSAEIAVHRMWGEPGAPRFLIVEFAPHAQWPGVDLHEPGPELVYVERGTLHDDGRTLSAGSFALYPAGSSHSPHAGPAGCRLIVVYPHG